jgi:hypothetical protein
MCTARERSKAKLNEIFSWAHNLKGLSHQFELGQT